MICILRTPIQGNSQVSEMWLRFLFCFFYPGVYPLGKPRVLPGSKFSFKMLGNCVVAELLSLLRWRKFLSLEDLL